MNDSLNLLYCLLDLELAKQQTTEEKPNSKVFNPEYEAYVNIRNYDRIADYYENVLMKKNNYLLINA